jgi:8-oxo-dGTP pyrophosphatase MutT (NUDIX family)
MGSARLTGTDAPQPIRAAATVVLWRDGPDGPRVLMGQRGSDAAFMPSKFVFPGGAVDPADAGVTLAGALAPRCAARLALRSAGPAPATLAAAAIRELWEETGLAMAVPGRWNAAPDAGEDWARMAAQGLQPCASEMRFIFRAITPPGRTRRFDARFFLAPASAIAGGAGDIANASGELSHLQWIAPGAARALDLPFITEVVLAEVAHLLGGGADAGAPFFDNATDRPAFRRLT